MDYLNVTETQANIENESEKQTNLFVPIPKEKESLLSYFTHASITNLYEYIRFNAFLEINNSEKLRLFKEMIYVPLRMGDILSKIVDTILKDDFELLQSIIAENKYDIESIRYDIETKDTTLVLLKDFNMIFEAYFRESDSKLASNLLTNLLCMDPLTENKEEMKHFIELYFKYDKKGREHEVNKIYWNNRSL